MNLKTIRATCSLSQSQLATKSGVSIGLIQKYESGERDINKAQVRTVHQLAQALGCTVEDLIETEKGKA